MARSNTMVLRHRHLTAYPLVGAIFSVCITHSSENAESFFSHGCLPDEETCYAQGHRLLTTQSHPGTHSPVCASVGFGELLPQGQRAADNAFVSWQFFTRCASLGLSAAVMDSAKLVRMEPVVFFLR